MDITSTSSVAVAVSQLSQSRVGDAVGISVLKKSLEIESQNAMQLLAALPQPAATGAVGNLGNNVNTFA